MNIVRQITCRPRLHAAAALLVAAPLAGAAEYYFDIVNKTNQAIVEVHVSATSDPNWGAPFRNVFAAHSGGKQRMEFAHGNDKQRFCYFDVRMTFALGESHSWRRV